MGLEYVPIDSTCDPNEIRIGPALSELGSLSAVEAVVNAQLVVPNQIIDDPIGQVQVVRFVTF
jgi:hypothetical protein